jgi:BirA family transcriptional regulator, biotin operon repressor / biotin---[acetyl-CoA-carboxylase] ligase
LTSSLPADVEQQLARAGGRLGLFEGRLTWYETVTSTNDVAARLAEHGAAEGLIVAANAQQAGRGRFGRSWASPAEAGLYVSIVLRPSLQSARVLTVAAGVAVAEGVESATGLAAALKWPNDVVLDGRKLAGILAEGKLADAGDGFVIVGFGINVSAAVYPAAVASRATSIERELGKPVDRGLVLVECLAAFASRYAELGSGRVAPVLEAWRARASSSLGRTVEWDDETTIRRGVAEDIDDSGALLVRTDGGSARIISGEVRWL